MSGVFGGAALAGSLAFGAIGHRLPRRLTFLVLLRRLGGDYLVLATLPPFPVTLVALRGGRAGRRPDQPGARGPRVRLVPKELRGRVFGAVTAGSLGGDPGRRAAGRRLRRRCRRRGTFLGIGVCYVAVIVYGFFNPAFRLMDDLDRDERPRRASRNALERT